MESLIEQDGRVVGVVVEHNGKTLRYQAKHGVILACGGFESNQQMRDQYLAKPTTVEWTAAPPINHGNRSEEPTSDLPVTNAHTVCRLLLDTTLHHNAIISLNNRQRTRHK